MSRKSWTEIKEAQRSDPAVRAGYEHAKRAYELARQVRELRVSRGMSQAELARKVGSTQPAIARLEAGGVAPNIDTLERIAGALGLKLVVRFSNSGGDPSSSRASAPA